MELSISKTRESQLFKACLVGHSSGRGKGAFVPVYQVIWSGRSCDRMPMQKRQRCRTVAASLLVAWIEVPFLVYHFEVEISPSHSPCVTEISTKYEIRHFFGCHNFFYNFVEIWPIFFFPQIEKG